MDRTVPRGAAILLDFIRETEVGSDGPESYNVIYAHKQHKLEKPLTEMTLGEIQDRQRTWSRNHGSSAAGGYQFMRATLKGLIEELGLSLSQKLDADLQDRLAYHLLKRRGYEAFMAGEMSHQGFAKRLAQEWASFPVLAPTQGAHVRLQRGASYYAGDGLNKALVSPDKIEALLERAYAAGNEIPPAPLPTPKPTGKAVAVGGLIAAIATAIAAGWERISTFFQGVFG